MKLKISLTLEHPDSQPVVGHHKVNVQKLTLFSHPKYIYGMNT
jgi:hypothetical protein